MEDDLDDLSIVVTGGLHGPKVVFTHMTALAHELCSKTHRGIGLEVIRSAAAVRSDFGVIELGEVLAKVACEPTDNSCSR